MNIISKSYLSAALNSDQTSSAYDYVDALAMLTASHPTIWTDHYKSKTPIDRRLRQFLKKGSQSGPREFWDRLLDVFKSIPREVLPSNAADAAEFLGSLHGGISRKDESRLSLETAFNAYLEIAASISKALSDDEQRKLLNELVLPIIAQYLRPTSENSQWNVPQNSVSLHAKAMSLGAMPVILREKWPEYAQQLVNDIKTSAPEQSKDYERSQNALVQRATRFALLQEQALRTEAATSLRSVFSQACSLVVSEALSVVRNRNGKPYGAAGAVAGLLHRNKDVVLAEEQATRQLQSFVNDDLPEIMVSPSSKYLVDILYSFSDLPLFKEIFGRTLKAVLKEDDSPAKARALEAILTSPKIPKSFDLATSDPELQEYIKSSVRGSIEGTLEWDSFNRLLQSPSKILSSATTDDILSYITQSLSLAEKAPYALQGLRQIVKQNPSMLKTFLSTAQGSNLLRVLLLASESPHDEISQGAAALNASIQTVLSAGAESKQSIYDLIQQGLVEATQTSVSVETLVDLAKQQVKPGSAWEEMKNVFPAVGDWDAALAPFLETAPESSLAITNPLSGAVYLVEPKQPQTQEEKIPSDADGYSAAYRITQYVTRLFKNTDLFPIERVPSELRNLFLRNIAHTIQLADDNLGLAGANGLWADYNLDAEADAISFMSDAQPFVTQELKRLQTAWSSSDTNSSLLVWATELLSKVEPDTSARAYHSARTYSVLVADAIEICGWKNSETAQLQDIMKTLRKSKGKIDLLIHPYLR